MAEKVLESPVEKKLAGSKGWGLGPEKEAGDAGRKEASAAEVENPSFYFRLRTVLSRL